MILISANVVYQVLILMTLKDCNNLFKTESQSIKPPISPMTLLLPSVIWKGKTFVLILLVQKCQRWVSSIVIPMKKVAPIHLRKKRLLLTQVIASQPSQKISLYFLPLLVSSLRMKKEKIILMAAFDLPSRQFCHHHPEQCLSLKYSLRLASTVHALQPLSTSK